MSKLSHFKNIIFDLGGVVLNLNYSLTVQAFKKFIPDLDEDFFLGKEKQLKFFSDYEIGLISTQEFKKQFEKHYSIHLTDEDFQYCWNAMILNFPLGRVELIRKLRDEGKQIFLLSNINDLHERKVDEKFAELNLPYQLKDLFHQVYYSHKISLRKPHTEIFSFVLEQNKLSSSDTLFVDDSFQHIVGAKKLGLETIHLKQPLLIEDFF